jgi:hypothetical protein
MSWEELELVLRQFNAIHEVEKDHEGERKPIDFKDKIAVLNTALAKWGYTAKDKDSGAPRPIDMMAEGDNGDAYNKSRASDNRNTLLRHKDGTPLDPAQYPGIGDLLPK